MSSFCLTGLRFRQILLQGFARGWAIREQKLDNSLEITSNKVNLRASVGEARTLGRRGNDGNLRNPEY